MPLRYRRRLIMRSFIVKRLLGVIPVLLLVAVIVFMLIHLIPGDPAAAMLGSSATPETTKALRESLGLDLPLGQQLLHWFKGALQGDLGVSVYSKRGVAELILQRMPVTLALAGYALIVSLLVAIPSGVIAAVNRNRPLDYLLMTFSMVGLSIPSFFLGLLLILFFSLKLGWFPSTGYVPLTDDFLGGLRSLTLPALALGFIQAAIVSRMMRSTMLDVLHQDYVRTARAKGMKEKTVILKHALRNALIPVITVIGVNVGILLSGTVIVESIFNLPGLGRLVVFSINNRDYPVIQGALLNVAAMYVLVNLVTDLVYGYVDPRIHYT